MTPAEIKEALKARGLTQRALARRARPRLSEVTIHRQVYQVRGGKSTRARRLIARALGKTEAEVFGDAA